MKKNLISLLLMALLAVPMLADGSFMENLAETNYKLLCIDAKAGTFLRFDTRNGELKIEQISDNIRDNCYEYDVENEKRVQLISVADKLVPGRFALERLEDRNAYLLFDTQEGKLWLGTITTLRQRWSVTWRPFTYKR